MNFSKPFTIPEVTIHLPCHREAILHERQVTVLLAAAVVVAEPRQTGTRPDPVAQTAILI